MSRFEEEISADKTIEQARGSVKRADSPVVIQAPPSRTSATTAPVVKKSVVREAGPATSRSTTSQVKWAAGRGPAASTTPTTTTSSEAKMSQRQPVTSAPTTISQSIAASLPPPPPPPPITVSAPPLGMRPPPPPPGPPPRPPPAFLPPQLRHRHPYPPRPPMMPMPMPPRPPPMPGPPPLAPPPMPPGMMPHMMGPHMCPPMGGPPNYPNYNPGNSMPTANTAPVTTAIESKPAATIEKPRVVYSALPVRAKKGDEKVAKKRKKSSIVSAKPPEQLPPITPVAPGIELNVPVEEIEAERSEYTVPHALATPSGEHSEVELMEVGKKEKKEKKKRFLRIAAGQTWEDPTLSEWDNDDFRLFCGDLGNEVTDEVLARAFSRYPTFVKAKVVRDKRSNKSRGFGFASFRDPNDFARAMREMNGKYVGNRPIKLRKSCWKERQVDVVRKKDREKKKSGFR